MTLRIRSSNIEASTLSNLSQVKISTIVITDSSYNNLDDLAVDTAGGYIKITGTGFVSGCTVVVGTQTASAVSFVSSTEVRAQIPAQSAGTYPLYVVNPDGATAIRVNAVNYSGVPTWTTTSPLSSSETDAAISIQFEANSATSYSLAVGSTLPEGLTLSNVGLLSGTISGLEVDTTYNFTVVATDVELQDTPRAFSITITSGDPYLKQTSLLLQADVTPFNSDASANAFAITVNGDTKPNNFNPYTPGYYSAYFDGTGDSLTVAANSAFVMGLDDFTIEAWCYQAGITQAYPRMVHFGPFAQSNDAWGILPRDGDYPTKITVFSSKLGGRILISSSDFDLNKWNHVAVTRDAGVFRLFVNGKLEAVNSSLINSTIEASATNTVAIGSATTTSGGEDFLGYISNVRILKGSVVNEYQTSSTTVGSTIFNPASAPLTNISDTSLLACQSNRFIDNSTNNFAITRNGDTRISSFIPFTPSSSYLSRGSGYFDGSGDYLTVATSSNMSMGTGDLTFECWIYATVANDSPVYECRSTNSNTDGFTVTAFSSTVIRVYTNAVLVTATIPNYLNTWVHVAYTRSGSTNRLFINGILQNTVTASDNFTNQVAIIGGGRYASSSITNFFTGYISNVRIVKGTAVYTANFTPPTEPLTAVAGTSLLTLQTNQPNTNSVFLDSSTNNFVITRAGDATQGSFSPYGANWSNYFDGTGDYLDIINSSTCSNFGTSDFTIEGWFYFNSLSTSILADFRTSPSDVAGAFYNNGSSVAWYVSGADRIVGGTLVINTWNHIAVCRSSSSTKLFLNGTQVGSTYSDSNNYVGNTNRPRLGFLGDGTGSLPYTGYMSNFRILKGTALYTENFTPPTSPLTAIANTSLLTCQSPQFVNNSPNRLAITRNGDVRVTNFAPFKAVTQTPVTYSNYFSSTDSSSFTNTNNQITFGTGDFTIEFWVNYNTPASTNTFNVALRNYNADPFTTDYFYLGKHPSATVPGAMSFWVANYAGSLMLSDTSLPAAGWNHFAIVRNGNTWTMYRNGTGVHSVTSSVSMGTRNNNLCQFGVEMAGYLSNLRVVKGTAVYTDDFTPPTQPLTAVAGTSLLTCQSDRLIDNSTNNFTLTAAGDVRPTTFAPFDPVFTSKQSYTPAIYGGSGYFDGTGDYLIVPTADIFNVGTDNFTIECWMYIISSPTYAAIFDTRSTGGLLNTVCGVINTAGVQKLDFVYAGARLTGSINIYTSQWCHLAITRTSGVIRLFVNGTQDGSVTYATSIVPNGTNTWVGAGGKGGSPVYFNGSISNLRIIKGQSLYTSNFVPPTAPLASITNTSLLLNFTDAGIADNTGLNVISTVGNAQISTVVKKYGTGSMYFDGTGDYLSVPSNAVLSPGTGDFTIECWLYLTAVSGEGTLFFVNISGGMNLFLNIGSNWGIAASGVGVNNYFGTPPTQNTWNHLAVSRIGSTIRAFINGTQVFSGSNTSNYAQGTAIVGSSLGYGTIAGYIDDLRITKGYARYTANFTPPGRLQSK